MNRPIQSVSRIGVVLGTSFPAISSEGLSLEDALTVIAEDSYFTAVELNALRDPANGPRIRSLCEQAELAVAYAAGPTIFGQELSINARDPACRLGSVQALQHCIDEAVSVGAQRVTLVSGPQSPADVRDQEIELLVDSLLRLCEYSSDRGGPPIDLETFDCEIERKRLLGPTALAVEVAHRVRAHFPSFGLLIDMSHVPLLGERIPQAFELAHEVLTHVHLGNCVVRDRRHPEFGDSHPRFGAPGSENGIEQLRATLRTLLDLHFLDPIDRPFLSFEVRPRPHESPRAVLAANKRMLESAWWGL